MGLRFSGGVIFINYLSISTRKSRVGDPFLDDGGRFAGEGVGGEFFEIIERDFYVDVDAAEQGAGDVLAVFITFVIHQKADDIC